MRAKLRSHLDTRWGRISAFALVVMLCLGTIAYLGFGVSQKIQTRTSATSDNVQWTLAQLEVEYLSFALAVADAQNTDTPDFETIRRKFDIFYSRIVTASEGQIFADLRATPSFRAPLNDVVEILEETAQIIDMDDEGLKANLGRLREITEPVHPKLRLFELEGINYFAALSDRNRIDALQTLSRVAALTMALVLALMVSSFVLFQLYGMARRTATQNRQTSARLNAMVASTLDAVIVTDEANRIVNYDGSAEQIFGYSRHEAIGADFSELIIPPKDRADFRSGMTNIYTAESNPDGSRGRFTIDALRKNGEVFPCELSIAEATTDNRKVFVSFLRDISAQEQAALELREARDKALAGEKAKADLLAVMSHEMRTPLNGMLGTMELLEATELTSRQREHLRTMEASGRMLLYHVNDVLEISRLDAGPVIPDQEPFSLSRLIQEVVDSQAPIAANNENTLDYKILGADNPVVIGDHYRLRQILFNLVSNAIKFTHKGAVMIEAERLSGSDLFEFRVSDTGIGIKEGDLRRIFDDFVTLDTSYARASSGTGLGLGIARRLVDALDGEIGAESEDGEGSLFWFCIPLPIQEGSTETERLPTPNDTREITPMNVLVVEDNRINQLVVEEMLSLDGHIVTLANDGLEGTRLAQEQAFDLILMDISMPHLDGVEAAKVIRTSDGPSADARIVALTAHALPSDLRRFREAGMDDTLIKPISRGALNGAIRSRPNSPALIDEELLLDLRRDLGDHTVSELLKSYVEETSGTLSRIASAPLEEQINLIHKLAGSSAMLGAAAFGRKLRDLETLGRSGAVKRMQADLPDLNQVWAQTRTSLQDQVLAQSTA